MSARGPSEQAILEALEHVYSHGIRLSSCHARNMLVRQNYIVGRRGKTGHGKWWMITQAGRIYLDELRSVRH